MLCPTTTTTIHNAAIALSQCTVSQSSWTPSKVAEGAGISPLVAATGHTRRSICSHSWTITLSKTRLICWRRSRLLRARKMSRFLGKFVFWIWRIRLWSQFQLKEGDFALENNGFLFLSLSAMQFFFPFFFFFRKGGYAVLWKESYSAFSRETKLSRAFF